MLGAATVMRLDQEHRLLKAEGQFAEDKQHLVGRSLWDQFPEGREVFGPIYEKAWQDGWCNRTVPYRGCAVQVHASRIKDELVVVVTVLTLDGLRETVDALLGGREEPASHPQDPLAPCCQVIPFPATATAR